MIPKLLHRVVPTVTTDEVEAYWRRFGELHPGWELRTWRDPLDPADFPLLGHLFAHAQTGASLADLVRLEVLWQHGGVYVDSDCEPVKPLDPLLGHSFFIGLGNDAFYTNAVMGSVPGHPAVRAYIDAIVAAGPAGMAQKADVATGPQVATRVLADRDDVTLLPPAAFYAEPWEQTMERRRQPADVWATDETYLIHRWHGSWLPPLTPYQRARRVVRRYVAQPLRRLRSTGA